MRHRCAKLALCVALTSAAGVARGAERVDLSRIEVLDTEARAPASSGAVRLTLDPKLQRAARALVASARAHEAALVASDVRTGRVLAWVSIGSHRDLVATPTAPSASIFKVATATALLEAHRVSLGTRQCYHGGEHAIDEGDLRDDPARDEACTSFGEALGHSINLVFARLALKHLTPDALRQRASLLGFQGAIPIDVEVPSSNVTVPADPLGFARAAAGFWNGRLSPLGALFAMQTVANGGERVRLRLLDAAPATRVVDGRAMSEATALALRQMLEVTTRRGTCARAFHHADGSPALPHVSVAAKSGTLIGGQPTRMYSWFAAFAPSNHPEIAVTVMLANDVSWWAKANSVGREFLETYFEGAPYEARQ